MQGFTYCVPTKIVFGKDVQCQVGATAKEFGASRVLVLYGGGSAVKSGLIGQVENALNEAGLFFVTKGGVAPNPRLSFTREVIALMKAENIDLLLAVGGGSTIDCAKTAALGACYEGDVWDFFCGKAASDKTLPVGVVLTIPAAGSETSNSMVITNDEYPGGWLKRGNRCEKSRPVFAMMNPELTYTLPPYQTACGVADIMMHSMERYFTPEEDAYLSDRLAEAVFHTVIAYGPKVLEDPTDYDARSEIMWAGSLSHNNLTGLGKGMDFATHQLEHELSGLFDVAHGAGLAAIWGAWARYVMATNVERFAQFAVNVWGIELNFQDPAATALAGIEETEAFFAALGLPCTLSELLQEEGQPLLNEAQIEDLAEKCVFFGKRPTIGTFRPLHKEDIKNIYRLALTL